VSYSRNHPYVYRELSAPLTTKTIEVLQRRISERFPQSGLGQASQELLLVGLLRKGPAAILGTPTKSSPKRELSREELARYLDYCCEMLSLIGKVVALYAQKLSDTHVVAAVNEIELLTTGLSRKIWQKMVLLGRPLND